MVDLIAAMIYGCSLLALVGLVGLAAWQSAQRGDRDGYRALQSRCAELEMMLNGVMDQRNQLARRVCELERYLQPYANLLQQLNARDQAQATLRHENQDLKQRLDGARMLVLALAAKAGVRIDQDPVSGGWRTM